MGISTNQWRATIGCFIQITIHSCHFEGPTCSLKVALLISILLIIGGVERNPGPPKRDVRLLATSLPARDESPLAETQSEKLDRILLHLDALTNDNKRIENKFDAFVQTMNTCFDSLKTEVDTHDVKIVKLTKDLEANSLLVQNDMSSFMTKLDSLKDQVALLGATHAPNISFSTPAQLPSHIGSIAKEIAARTSRRNNILITGLPHDTVTADEDRVRKIIINDLHLTNDISTIPQITCKCIGKSSAKPRALLVTFNDAHYRDRALSNAK